MRLEQNRLIHLPVLPVHTQHLAQQENRFQQIAAMDNPPLTKVVPGIEHPAAVATRILADDFAPATKEPQGQWLTAHPVAGGGT